MIRSVRSTVLLLARCGAVAFALTACGYLVVTAQRRANPVPEEAPVTPIAAVLPADATPANDAPFLPSSKVLVIDGSDALTVDGGEFEVPAADSTFLLGTKSAPIAGTVLEGNASPESRFLYSSKSGAIAVRPPLLPETTTMDGALPLPPMPDKSSGTVTSQVAPDGTATPVEPVFLPSSKVKTQLNPLRPPLVPGSTTTSRRTFLPSSKSLRIDPVAPAPKPAPVDPPKNP